MVPPKRANFNMVSQTIFHIFTYHMPIVPPQVKQTSQRTMDLVKFPIDLSLIAQSRKSVLSSLKLNFHRPPLLSRLWLL